MARRTAGDRYSTATRIRTLGGQAVARVYRARTRSRLTGRAALLALVVCSLVVALAYPMRQWISQRSEIDDQRRRAEQARERVEELRELRDRWQDPAFVEQQAREHLHYVRPGETGYTLTDAPGAEEARDADRRGTGRPWYSNLWDAVDRVDGPRG
ncbi:FtsB family cell division protein [Streptomyces sp. URMC 123]|uniref:FtsB family cell division protein n=1 Tax=Streptomyces sp. URMC 123 TaxID=3423403 RepID=UPI003F1C3F9C